MPTPTLSPVDTALRRVDNAVRRQAAVLACISSFMELLMPNQQDLINEIEGLKQAIIEDEAADQAKAESDAAAIGQLNETIEALEAQLAAGNDTQPLIDKIRAARDLLKPPTSGTPTVPGETPVPTDPPA